jgi:uncharacterized protein
MNDDASPTRPRRLLAIDGGGLAGLIPAECLIAIESQLDHLTGTQKPLCERFDLIGGTSTGAILAAGLARGLTASDLRDFYLKYGHEIFAKSWLPGRIWHKYPSGPLEQRLKEVLGKSTVLGSGELRTQIMMVAKNAMVGSDWFFSNNPKSKFFKNNAKLPMWQIVRASSAAPTYFPPENILVIDETGKKQRHEFIDGGVSSYNNPALQVFLEATVPDLRKWVAMGADQLMLISLGTGFSPLTIPVPQAARYWELQWAKYLIKELMNEANLQQSLLMHLIGCRPEGIHSATQELVSSGAASGAPDKSALDRVSGGLGEQKLARISGSPSDSRSRGWKRWDSMTSMP